MEALVRIDETLIDFAERSLFAVRNRLDISFPKAIGLSASTTIVLMAFSVFLSSGNLVTVKIPLLCMYAVLAFVLGRTVLHHLAYFSKHWGPEAEKILSRDALGNRARFRRMRALLAFVGTVSVLWSLTGSLRLLDLGEISLLDAGRELLSSLLGMPVLLAYHYLLCARPTARCQSGLNTKGR
ncbi:hypothetical protein GOB57_21270 [Sinorhizobium meliloti]|nr:hypothetical protein [Sinorhizobium meliloti]